MDIKETMEELRKNPKLMAQITQSSSGKKLLASLEKSSQWETAAKKMQQGDVQAVSGLLKQVVADPNSRALLERLSKELQ